MISRPGKAPDSRDIANRSFGEGFFELAESCYGRKAIDRRYRSTDNPVDRSIGDQFRDASASGANRQSDLLNEVGKMVRMFLSILFVGALLFGCAKSRPPDAQTGSQTNWLKSCERDSTCAPFRCICGICTESCTDDDECSRDDQKGICIDHRNAEVEICIASTTLSAICYPELDGPSATWDPRSSTSIEASNQETLAEASKSRITLALTAGDGLFARLDNGDFTILARSESVSQDQTPWVFGGAVFERGKKFAFIASENNYILYDVETASMTEFPLQTIIDRSNLNNSYTFLDAGDGLVVLAKSWPQYALWENRENQLQLVIAGSQEPIYYAGISMGRFIFATEKEGGTQLLLLARGPDGWKQLTIDRIQTVGEDAANYDLSRVLAARHADRLALLYENTSGGAPIPFWIDLLAQQRVGPIIEMSDQSIVPNQVSPFVTAVISSNGNYGAVIDANDFYLADLIEETYQSFDKLGSNARGKYLYGFAFRTNWQNGEQEDWVQLDELDTGTVRSTFPREGSQIAIIQIPAAASKDGKIAAVPCSVYATDIRDGESIQKLFDSDSCQWQGPLYLPDGNISIAYDDTESGESLLLIISPELDVETLQLPESLPGPLGDIFGTAPMIETVE